MSNLKNYVLAEIRRVFLTVPFLVILALCLWYVGSFAIGTNHADGEINSIEYLGTIINDAKYSYMLIGFVLFLTTLYNEFSTKTMQAAIGRGLSRRNLIIGKMITEFVVLLIYALLMGVVFVVGIQIHSGLEIMPEDIRDIVAALFCQLTQNLGIIYICMIFVFLFQGAGVAMLLYIAMITGLLGKGFSYISVIPILAPIDGIYFMNIARSFESKLVVGIWDWSRFLGIIATFVGCFLLSYLAFRKKELEF